MLTVEQFIAATHQVIAKDGFDGYLPTLVVEEPTVARVAVLEDVPPDVDVEGAAKQWVLRATRDGQDYLLAFKVDDRHFKVVSRAGGNVTERVVEVESD